MLFNSHEFILLFLPISLLGFFLISSTGHYQIVTIWLVAVSMFFYAWWNPVYLKLLIFSILFNYYLGIILSQSQINNFKSKLILSGGISFNLALLGYFKYAIFLITVVNSIINTNFTLQQIILPLAISFFTFQQIAYLIDAYRGKTKEYSFLNYCLFVSFFPQLIAGPIVHHQEIIPQFEDRSIYKFEPENLAIGLAMFSIGLFKKVIIADGVAIYVNQVFDLVAYNTSITFTEAWVGAFAFYLQIYFDFSAYSDMALGTARTFGIKLPLNFNSPYQATNMSEAISRWHITLNRFLRDYLSIPISRLLQKLFKSKNNQGQQILLYINIIITMLLSGLWHGAGWTFILWGGYLGVCIVIYYLWRDLCKLLGQNSRKIPWWHHGFGWFITMLASVVSLVFFRAESLNSARIILQSMFSFNKISLPTVFSNELGFLSDFGITFNGLMPHIQTRSIDIISWIGFLLLIVWLAPNTQYLLKDYHPALDSYVFRISLNWRNKVWHKLKLKWQLNQKWAIVTAIMMLICILRMTQEQEFIYFQF
ncbi:MBOAT family protein [Myxosarcina sp. GI1]|uniref:MBOAT family O-acyltransferase n=1 Tax=Myxosarcina sp. GI1 TaxID=1541065 RepID=UPI00055BDB24|nr:MBOAT family O-acyltransferase [Myxosarcina sp. GI1]